MCLISIYLAPILDWILNTHMLVVSHNAKHWPLHACPFDALSTYASSYTGLLFMCVFFLVIFFHSLLLCCYIIFYL
jgi:hypothetical protein